MIPDIYKELKKPQKEIIRAALQKLERWVRETLFMARDEFCCSSSCVEGRNSSGTILSFVGKDKVLRIGAILKGIGLEK